MDRSPNGTAAPTLDAERGRADLLVRTELRILDLVASGAPLATILTETVLGFEAQSAGMVGSVLLVDGKEGVVRHGAAPHLPDAYNAAIDGEPIGPYAGSCGTAAFTKKRVVVTDIATDARWAKYRDIALKFGLAACWSEPIFDRHGEVVGTFAMYYRTRREPSPWDVGFIEIAAKLASIAISQSRADVALRASEEQLRRALAAARMGTWDWNITTGALRWSDGVEALLDVPAGSFAGTYESFLSLCTEEDRAAVICRVDDVLTGRANEYDNGHRIPLADGSVRWLEARGRVERDAEGRALRMIGTVADVTARKTAEEALRASEALLRQSQKMDAIGRLAGGIAHDFNNLLTVIGASSAIALDQVAPESRLHTYLTEIAAASDRAANLTRQLLAFSRQRILSLRVLDLNEVVGDVARLLERVLGASIELRTPLAPDLGPIRADPGQIEQIVMNLAVNARDAMARGGVLTIETARAEWSELPIALRDAPLGAVRLSVHDTGHGMDAATQAHMFEPFFTTKELGQGTGLGLSTVYGIVERLSGRVTFHSEVGKGTTFSVFFPCVDATAPKRRPTDPPSRPLPASPATILLVEDEPSVRMLVQASLLERGYVVLVATSGREAWEMHERHEGPIDLLVTDVIMPLMDGAELVSRLAPARPRMKVLFISGHADDSVLRGRLDACSGSFMQKPFTMAELEARVGEMLGRPRSVRGPE